MDEDNEIVPYITGDILYTSIFYTKLSDLRAIDVKSELDKRGLKTTGCKSDLMDRLATALREEGKDPDDHLFEIVADKSQDPKKFPVCKRTNSEKTQFFWSDEATQFLLSLYDANKENFNMGNKRKTWGKIASLMAENDYPVSDVQCENRFKYLLLTYKKAKENEKNGNERMPIKYMGAIEDLLEKDKSLIKLVETSSSKRYVDPTSETSTCNGKKGKRHAGHEEEEPEYFKKFRKEMQQRHEERMEQNQRFLNLMEELINVVKNVSQ